MMKKTLLLLLFTAVSGCLHIPKDAVKCKSTTIGPFTESACWK